MKPLVIYHAHCTDGFGAAFAAWLKFGDDAEYLPMAYGNIKSILDVDLIGDTNRAVYILDFSFPRDVMEFLFVNAQRVVWLDHHKTAFEMWCGNYEKGMMLSDTNGCYGDGNHDIILNDNKSGALLAWEWFHGGEVPMLFKHVDDRDRWQFDLKGSKELHAGLAATKPWSFQQWHDLLFQHDHNLDGPFLTEAGTDKLKLEGAAILRAQNADIASMVKQTRACMIQTKLEDMHYVADFRGLACNASVHISELGHVVATQSGTYGLIWYLSHDNKVKCSLRSNGNYDVSAIAKSFGGGGHRNAAGFETDFDTLMNWLK